MSIAEEIKKLSELRDSGVISEEDFQSQKNTLLSTKKNGYLDEKSKKIMRIIDIIFLAIIILYASANTPNYRPQDFFIIVFLFLIIYYIFRFIALKIYKIYKS